jgi:hypothetical protein
MTVKTVDAHAYALAKMFVDDERPASIGDEEASELTMDLAREIQTVIEDWLANRKLTGWTLVRCDCGRGTGPTGWHTPTCALIQRRRA